MPLDASGEPVPSMRAFVAVDVPPIDGPVPPELRPEDHLTLQFFDHLEPERLSAVVDAMTEAVQDQPPFAIEVRGVGAFPSPQRPRVVWAGVGAGAASLQSLAGRLRRAVAARGFPVEARPFVPHLTLGRLRSPRDLPWALSFLQRPENAGRRWTQSRVSELLLKESELLPTGARHTVRARVPLVGAPSPP